MNRPVPPTWKALAVLLAAVMAGAPVAAAAAESVTLTGRIFQADGTTPLQGAFVRVINQETGEVSVSKRTDAAGKYKFKDLSPGIYTFEVQVTDGTYQLDRSVRLGDSETASISFTVKPEPDIPAAKKEGMSKKKKGTLIAIISSGAVFLGTAASNRGDASPFTP